MSDNSFYIITVGGEDFMASHVRDIGILNFFKLYLNEDVTEINKLLPDYYDFDDMNVDHKLYKFETEDDCTLAKRAIQFACSIMDDDAVKHEYYFIVDTNKL